MSTAYLYETIKLHKDGGVAKIKLNRPDSLNALNTILLTELLQLLTELKADKNIAIIELTGEGRAFSSGGDIKLMIEQSDEESFLDIMNTINELVMMLYTMPKLVISGVHGAVAGLGLSLALASDYIICEETSKLAMNFIGIALIPDGGSHYFLQERVGIVNAKKLIWSGKVLDGQEALMKGLVDEVIPNGKLRESLDRYESLCLQQPLQAMLKTKEIFVEMNKEKLEHALMLERQGQWQMRETEDHQEGLKAFIEKRKPIFKGK